ncbi:endo-1,4-beta-xylanase [Pedobacter cryophilus]|uniref:Beta-xylanase n=1 Tax=Pedobacter cryophilus TaxID=2571271 RepID=A0A4U1BX61_9SPHI|nr:endo-1,4-beta-xylanase [Pedobacter cryophilus]TKB96921.1 endo-1,4-beta-xylanase [Pedobacter cryophilus]
MKKAILIVAAAITFAGCKKSVQNITKEGESNLVSVNALTGNERLQTANVDVQVGVAIALNPYQTNTLYSNLVKQEYNSITAENDMKFGELQPAENDFYLDDTTIEHAAKYNGNKRIHGHALIWYSSNPGWLDYVDANTSAANKYSRFKGIMEKHISTVVKHYSRASSIYKDAAGKPLMKSWDVVNEVFNDNGTYRGSGQATSNQDRDFSVWYKNLPNPANGQKGIHHVELAFRAARKAANENGDTDLKLFYNDFGHEYSKAKTDAIFAMVNYLKNITEGGKPIIDGVGLQFHMNYATKTDDTPANASGNIEYAIRKMKETGLKVHISELDISRAKKEINGSINNDLTTEQQRKDGQYFRYYYVPQMYRAIVPANQRWGITLWNVGDSDSWLRNPSTNNGYATLYNPTFYTKKYTYERFYDGLKNAITVE